MSLLTRNRILERLDKPGPEGLFIDPLLEDDQIGQVAIDLRLGYDFLVSILTRKSYISVQGSDKDFRSISSYFQTTRREIGERFIVYPGQTVLTTTLEYVSLPTDVYADIMSRSSYARLGIHVNAMIQPGFRGSFPVEIFNHSNNPVELIVGSRIIQARFTKIEEHLEYEHGKMPRKYSGGVRPIVSKADLDREIEEKFIKA